MPLLFFDKNALVHCLIIIAAAVMHMPFLWILFDKSWSVTAVISVYVLLTIVVCWLFTRIWY